MNIFSAHALEGIVKKLLYAFLFVAPLLFSYQLYFPFLTGKAYALRLFVGVAFFFWVVLLMRSPMHRPRFRNLLIIALLVFLVGYVITGLTGVDVTRSFFSTSERSDGVIQFGVWVLYFLMLTSVFRGIRDWQIAFGTLVLSGLLSSLFGLSKLGTIFGLAQVGTGLRIIGTFGNPSFFGAFIIFVIGFTSLFFIKSFSPFQDPLRRKIAIPLAALLIFFMVILVMTQTRGDYIGFLAGLFMFAILTHFFPRKTPVLKKFIIALDALSIALVIFFAFVLAHPNSAVVERYAILKRVANSVETTSVRERIAEWEMAIQGFQDRPIVGWGAENFMSVSNKYYDYHIGLIDQWFDRPHNQTLQVLSEGGITLFAGYLLVIVAILLFLYKIFKHDPFLASATGAIFTAYYVQNLFLFDTFATYIGFFTLLGFTYYLYEQYYPTEKKGQPRNWLAVGGGGEVIAWLATGVSVVAFIWYTVWVPLVNNPSVLEYNARLDARAPKEADEYLSGSFAVSNPYLEFDIKKGAAWELLIKYLLDKDVTAEDKPYVLSMYKKITPELAKIIKGRPYEPQSYFLLGSMYRIGYEQLGEVGDLARSEAVLRQGLALSPMRIEYVDAMSQTLLAEKKLDDLERLISGFVSGLDQEDSYRYLTLGNYYYLTEKYVLAFEQYLEAQKRGFSFLDSIVDRDYDRYLIAAQETRNFEKAVEMIRAYLEKKGPHAPAYFNLAVALIKLGKTEESRAAYQMATALDPVSYKQYERFFE